MNIDQKIKLFMAAARRALADKNSMRLYQLERELDLLGAWNEAQTVHTWAVETERELAAAVWK